MENIRGGSLLNELFDNPKKFNKNQFKGYNLLNEYLSGFNVETLIPILESDNELIYRVAISIASELNEYSCSFILPYLIPLLKKEQDPLYLHYLLSAIFKGTYESNHEEFSNIVFQIKSKQLNVQTSAMNLIAIANIDQLIESFSYIKEFSNDTNLIKGLSYLTEENTRLDEKFIKGLIQNNNKIIQLFGGIIAMKFYEKYPDLMVLSSKSLNDTLSKFSKEIIEVKNGMDQIS